jgi:hypothetical protein
MVAGLHASYNASVALCQRLHHSLFGLLASVTHLLCRLFQLVILASRPRLPSLRPALPRLPVVSSVVGVLSSTLLPGFSGPESSVLFADLSRFAPLLFRGHLSQLGFMAPLASSGSRAGALPGVRRVASSYRIRLQYALSLLRISGLASSGLLAPRHVPI